MGNPPVPSRPFVLLIAEDDDDEYALAALALKSDQARMDIQRVPNGQACMAYLRGEARYSAMPFPDLLLLDINMPGMNGFDVMGRIAADERLRQLPVVVFSSSSEPADVQRMYQMRCSSYIAKPTDFNVFRRVLHDLVQYWVSAVTLPAGKLIG